MHPREGDRLVPSLLAGHLPGRMGKGESSVSMSCRARCNIGHTGEENIPSHIDHKVLLKKITPKKNQSYLRASDRANKLKIERCVKSNAIEI